MTRSSPRAAWLDDIKLDAIKSDDLEAYSYWTAEVFDSCLADPEQALAIHQGIVSAGRYPSQHSDILVRIARNTVQQAAQAKIKRLLDALARDSDSLDPALNDIVPQVRALAEQ